MVKVWTDGCCMVNPGGAGGWAFVIEEDGQLVHQAQGGDASTTNNKMEMKAVIEAIRYMRSNAPGVHYEIVSDSEYVVKGLNEWAPRWKANGWRKGGPEGKRPKNLDLWKELDYLFNPGVMSISWVRGHDGQEFNELADHLAGVCALTFEDRKIEDPADQPLPS